MNTVSKSPAKSVTVWGAISTVIFGLLSLVGIEIAPGELGEVANALGILAGFAVTLYGRIRAKVLLRFRGGTANLLLLASILSVCLPLVGCALFSPSQQESIAEAGIKAGKIAASVLINAGLAELSDRVKETRPWIRELEQTITFAPADATPEQLASTIDSYLQAVPDTDTAALIREQIQQSLDEGTATAFGPKMRPERRYIAQLRAALD